MSTDVLDVPLQIGDRVVAIVPFYKALKEGTVVAVTPKGAKIDFDCLRECPRYGKKNPFFRESIYICKPQV